MYQQFVNVHTHIFNSVCAPKRFLLIVPSKITRKFGGLLKSALDTNSGRQLIRFLLKASRFGSKNERREIERYLSFLDIGLMKTQLSIFQQALESGKSYDASIKIVALTLNMDHMDSTPGNHKPMSTQLAEVMDIKRYYPNTLYPFLSIDPREASGPALEEYAKKYFTAGFESKGKVYRYFYGIKLYPALGFFPFDRKMHELYAFAERYHLPIMTHCTRVGSQYIGNAIQTLIPPGLVNIMHVMPSGTNDNVTTAMNNIRSRVAAYYAHKDNWIKNNKYGANDYACDLFGHPENYIPLLETFPNLKVCLAHMGGDSEFLQNNELDPAADKDLLAIRKIDPQPWMDRIRDMMIQYPNLYTDVSYTLSVLDEKRFLDKFIVFLNTPDNFGGFLGDRVLFGTDFYMTEREEPESDLYKHFLTIPELQTWMYKITHTNCHKYLFG